MDKSDQDINEAIVFVIRETGWSLEYIRALPIGTFNQFLKELRYQKKVDEYRNLRGFAMALANWASSKKRGVKFRIEDFIGDEPTRKSLEVTKNE